MRIHHIYISPGHNFFGHHGRSPGDHPTTEVESVECLAGRGLVGDRFLDYAVDYKGQITLFSMEVFAELCRVLGPENRDPALVRRNVLVSGVDLGALIGQEFDLQDVRLLGVEECRPCYWMDLAVAPGAEALLAGRGGLRCQIVRGGTLRTEGSP